MRRRALAVAVLAAGLALVGPAPGAGAAPRSFTPGASGVGDPYYPLDGNGGYDVKSYALELRYDPSTDILSGTATIKATATQDLSAFDLDLVGLNVRSVEVGGKRTSFTRSGQELIITPAKGIKNRSQFEIRIRYDGIPEPTLDLFGGISGFVATDDGAIVAGQPHGAATWFPANDHPIDKASYEFEITVPAGVEAVANGKLDGQRTRSGWTTWTWEADDPMATYLATIDIGQFDISAYRSGRIQYWDALDPDLFRSVAEPSTGTQFALSGAADSSYKRLLRPITVPAGGATVEFTVTRDTEQDWDYFFVETHTVGADDWTTLADANGHTSSDTGNSCSGWQSIHPFLAHYQTVDANGTCSSAGSSGQWFAATGASTGPEHWQVAIPASGPGRQVELSLSYASDEVVQRSGVYIDDIVVSTGDGNTSFENDGDTLDGWSVPGPPANSPGNDNDWFPGTAADVAAGPGLVAQASFARQPEIQAFLADNFGPYPFRVGGGIVDDAPLGFALETQTRPIYSSAFFSDPLSADSVVVHENAHQWFGDNLAVAQWQHIWLNEGFATYAEWLWAEHEGFGTPQDTFEGVYNGIPDDDPFWALTIGDPGAGSEFDLAVYYRGAMTLQALRQTVGDDAFFTILRQWARQNAGGNVTTSQFIDLAQRVSGQDLGPLFNDWLFTSTKPPAPAAPSASVASRSAGSTVPTVTPPARAALERVDGGATAVRP